MTDNIVIKTFKRVFDGLFKCVGVNDNQFREEGSTQRVEDRESNGRDGKKKISWLSRTEYLH